MPKTSEILTPTFADQQRALAQTAPSDVDRTPWRVARRHGAATALLALALVDLVGACKASSSEQSITTGGTYYNAGGYQNVRATGASVSLSQEAPSVGGNTNISRAEIAVESADRKQIIETGWQVNPALTGDVQPRLFVTYTADGVPMCYNGCGFMPVKGSIALNSPVQAGQAGDFSISHAAANHEWVIAYDNHELGYLPDALWKGDFTAFDVVGAMGVVNSSGTTVPCASMGNGKRGTSPGAAIIKNFDLAGTKVAPDFTPYYAVTVAGTTAYKPLDANEPYNAHLLSPTSLAYGGPGVC